MYERTGVTRLKEITLCDAEPSRRENLSAAKGTHNDSIAFGLMDLQTRLLGVEAESVDANQAGDVLDDTFGVRVFGRFSQQVLEVYREKYPDISASWVSVAGLEPAVLRLIASCPESIHNRIPDLSKHDAQSLAEQNEVELIPHAAQHSLFNKLVPRPNDALVIRLIGYDEYYGILVLCSQVEGFFRGGPLTEIKESSRLLNRLMAEANFSMRLKRIAAPFDFPVGPVTKELMFSQIVRQSCRGLAADGAVVRIRKPSSDHYSGYSLEVADKFGVVDEPQLAEGSVDERICRQVFDSPDFVTVQSLLPDGRRAGFGVAVSDEDNAELLRFGVQAYMIMKLQSDVSTETQPTAMGTLSVFHRVPQAFSRRDISLFRGFCERVADDLALLEQRDENEAISKHLQAQNTLGNRAEITALLGHDFGHRVYHVKAGLEDFIDTCTRLWRDRSLPESITAEANDLRKRCAELAQIVQQLRTLGQGTDESPGLFSVEAVFTEIRQKLATVLDRNSMAIETKMDGNSHVFGVRGILLQVLYNLVINSIDAQKESGRKKKNIVHISCREVGSGTHRKLEFKIWDDGPGISRTAFPDPTRIFAPGASSKPPGVGTGIGLSSARLFLGRYFHSDLQLVDRSKALFQFSIPSQIDGKYKHY
jgi:signal transduction histidine kinase